ncbi:helix-turn-helix domain-containing protein [Belnapia sp. T18]|uniref:Helix-turn-helix domain-containing protein n=1 Tax=Belnapia arida TaxID=2804533 RepID=A0ABS1U9N2_9PROT|nr:helix-turn-helix domain-containing protein [Belnapia arida]
MNVGERFAWLRAVIAAQPRPTLAEVAAAATLAEHFNAERGGAWPAQQTIASLTRMERRSVRRALACLEERGLVARVRDGGPRSSTVYALVMPADGAPQRQQRASHNASSGRSTVPPEGAAGRPEQGGSRSENEGKPYRAAGARCADAARARSRWEGKKKSPPRPVSSPLNI